MAARRRSGTRSVRVTTGKLESLRAVLARHRVAELSPDAPDRALIDTALDIAAAALVDPEAVAPPARVKTPDAVPYVVSGSIGHADVFLRDQPVSAWLPEGIRELVREVIDHGGFIIRNWRFPNAMSQSHRMVIAALFRRILITAEAVRVLTERGLEEPAIATLRTLSELEVTLRLVASDPTERMARRLIYFCAVRGRRHFTKAADDAETRSLSQENGEHWPWAVGMSRFFKDRLSSDEFADVRAECKGHRYWHGYNNQREAFTAVGMSHDYHTLFDSASSFVHATNVEHDVTEAGTGVREVVQMDPVAPFSRLAYLASNLTVIFGVLLEATGQTQGYGPAAAIVDDDGAMEEIDAFELLQARVLSVLEAAQEDMESGGTDATAALAQAFYNQAVAVLKSRHLRRALDAFSRVLARFEGVRSPEVQRCVGAALLNKGYLHGQLEEPEKAIAAYDEAVRRFGDSALPDLRRCAAMSLRNKGSTLAMSSPDAAVAVWDDLVERFGDDESDEIQLEVAIALVKKTGSALLSHKGELAIASCKAVVARYDDSEDSQLQKQLALALEMKGMAQNQLGLPNDALATYEELVERFGATACDRGIPISWRAIGIQAMALALLDDEVSALSAFRRLCAELDAHNSAMLQKLVWDTIDLAAQGVSPGPLADALADVTEGSEVLVPLKAALHRLSGESPHGVSPDLRHFVDDIIRKIEARASATDP